MEKIGSNVRTGQPLAVVVGAGGMAMAAARRLGANYRLLVADRDSAHLQRQVDALRIEGHDVDGVTCDVTDAEAVRAAADAAASIAPVRALAHVVGLAPAAGDPAAILRVNIRGAALVADAFLPVMSHGGAGLFVASMSAHLDALIGEVPSDVLAVLDDPLDDDLIERVRAKVGEITPAYAYQLSKTSLLRLVRRRVTDWAARDARILSVSPGMISTPQGALEFRSPEKRGLYELTPLRREGTMIEIVDAFEFLLSDRASFITGVDLLVDGGLAAAARNMADGP